MALSRFTAGLLAVIATAPSFFAATSWDLQAAYHAREAALKAAVEARPKNVQALLDLAAFYLRPAAPREVRTMDGSIRTVMVPLKPARRIAVTRLIDNLWTFNGDPDLAKPLLDRAVQLDGRNPAVLRLVAYYLRMKDALGSIEDYLTPAMAADPQDLDLIHIYFDWQMELARQLNEQAEMLRAPTWLTERRGDRLYKVLTPAGPGAVAQANDLDAQADKCRTEAIRPVCRVRWLWSENPAYCATSLIVWSPDSSSSRAFLSRASTTYWCGDRPVDCLNSRAKWYGLRATERAIAAIVRSVWS